MELRHEMYSGKYAKDRREKDTGIEEEGKRVRKERKHQLKEKESRDEEDTLFQGALEQNRSSRKEEEEQREKYKLQRTKGW